MPRPRKFKNKGHKCSIKGCERPAWRRGWCKTHATRYYNWGSPFALARRGPRKKGRSLPVVYIREGKL